MFNIKNLINNYLKTKKRDYLVSDINRGYSQLEFLSKVKFIKKKLIEHSKGNSGVGILLDRNVDYLAAIFACLSAGKYYVPLSLRSTKKLINYQIRTSKIETLIIYDKKSKKKLKFKKIKINKNIQKKEKIAYLIFTSGSTGPKKAVSISYKSFSSYILAIKKNFRKKFNSKSLLINGELTFDIFNADLAFALLYKTEICITPDPLNIFSFFLMLEKRKTESIYAVPTAWQNIIETGKKINKKKFLFIKQINSGGETLSKSLYLRLKKFAPNAKIFNFYGPTEFTINSHNSEIKLKNDYFYRGNATIGSCLYGVNYKLLNPIYFKNKIIGELALSGKQLMEGYVNSNENPIQLIDKKKYYLTGDSFILKKKKFFFNGRLKDYIKISGYRVNILDLEDQLSQYLNSKVYMKFMNECLFLYCLDKKFRDKINFYISKKFEWYERPKIIKYLKKFPLSSSGKIDKNKLN